MRKSGKLTQTEVQTILEACDKPLTAYDVLAVMKKTNEKIAPPTVYRALAALVEQGSVHRIESLNAYKACSGHDHSGTAIMAICDDCGTVEEQIAPELDDVLGKVTSKSGFKTDRHVIELRGQCASCETERT